MPRQRMEHLANIGGRMLNLLREELKKNPDEVLLREEELSEDFDPNTLPIFLVRHGDLVGAVGVMEQEELRTILTRALLNDVGMVKVREEPGNLGRKVPPHMVPPRPEIEQRFVCDNCNKFFRPTPILPLIEWRDRDDMYVFCCTQCRDEFKDLHDGEEEEED